MKNKVYDVFGVGFGPAGISLAIALLEDSDLSFKWAEKSKSPGWQPGLLLEGSNINHHLYRDLATPRNPRSEFTFANFLKVQGRLYDFGYWNGAVSRIEWHLYVIWVAEKFEKYVDYDTEISDINYDEETSVFIITTSTGEQFNARSVVVSAGMEKNFPTAFKDLPSKNIRHGCDFLSYRNELEKGIKEGDINEVLVVGSGLGGIEIVDDLFSNFRNDISIDSTHRNMPFRNYEQSNFSNTVYTPEESEYFKSLPKAGRDRFLTSVLNTNFSGVDDEISTKLWNKVYEAKLFGINSLNIIPRVEPVVAKVNPNGKITVKFHNNFDGKEFTKVYDFVISATGVIDTIPTRIFSSMSHLFKVDVDGSLILGSEYNIQTTKNNLPCYANGHYEE